MPENSNVNVVFTADTSSMTAAFAKLEGELKALGAGGAGRAADFGKPIAEGAAKASGGLKEASQHLSMFGKFAEQAKEKVHEFGSDLMKFGLATAGIAGGFEMLKHSIDLASEAQKFHAQLEAILGDVGKAKEMAEGAEKISSITSLSEGSVAGSEKELLMAGMDPGKITETTLAMAMASKVYGGSLEELAAMMSHASMKGDQGVLSAREFNRIAQSLGPSAQEARKEYQGMDYAVEQSNQALEKTSILQQRAYKEAMQVRDAVRLVAQERRDDARIVEAAQKSAHDAFNEKTGLTGKVGQDFVDKLKGSSATYYLDEKGHTQVMGSMGSSSGPYSLDSAGRTQVGGSDRAQGLEMQSHMREGMQYLAQESGRTLGEMARAVASGQFTPGDLLKGYDEKRVAARDLSDKGESHARAVSDKGDAQSQERKVRDTQDTIAQATLTEKLEKRALAETELAKLTEITTQKINDFFKEEQTGAAQMEKAQHIVENFWKAMGGGLLQGQAAVIQNPQLAGAAIGVMQNPFGFLGELIKGQVEASKKNADALEKLTSTINDLNK